MKLKYAETLDLCMEQLFSFIDKEYGRDTNSRKKLKDLLLNIFENLILPTYNSHHIQFSIFYYCSLKVSVVVCSAYSIFCLLIMLSDTSECVMNFCLLFLSIAGHPATVYRHLLVKIE